MQVASSSRLAIEPEKCTLDPVQQRNLGLSLAQAGDQHDAAKVLKGFGGAGVLEVVESDIGGTYRAVYTVKFKEAVFFALLPEKE